MALCKIPVARISSIGRSKRWCGALPHTHKGTSDHTFLPPPPPPFCVARLSETEEELVELKIVMETNRQRRAAGLIDIPEGK